MVSVRISFTVRVSVRVRPIAIKSILLTLLLYTVYSKLLSQSYSDYAQPSSDCSLT